MLIEVEFGHFPGETGENDGKNVLITGVPGEA
jgi:hypothetical protein